MALKLRRTLASGGRRRRMLTWNASPFIRQARFSRPEAKRSTMNDKRSVGRANGVGMYPDLSELPAWTDHYFLRTKAGGGAVRRQARHLCGVHAPAGDLGAAAGGRLAAGRSPARAAPSFNIELHYRRGQVGRRRRADHLHLRLVRASGRSRDDFPAEARPGLRRRLQRLHHVRRSAEGRASSPWMRATAPARRWPR